MYNIQAVDKEAITRDSYEKERIEVLDNIKPELNSFLWTRLPPNMTLSEAETVACDITSLVSTAWERHEP